MIFLVFNSGVKATLSAEYSYSGQKKGKEMASKDTNSQLLGKDEIDNCRVVDSQNNAKTVAPSADNTKAKTSRPKEKVGSYTQLLRQHQKKSSRNMVCILM